MTRNIAVDQVGVTKSCNEPISIQETTSLQRAQWCVGAAMVSCLGMWFLPVLSGAVCSAIESTLVHKIFRIMDCHSEAAVERVYWFFRKKTFFLFGATYIPIAGVPLQLFETYGLGQFAIHCALKPNLLTDGEWLEQSWNDVAPDIFSGEHATQSYEQFTGKTFPKYARKRFVVTINTVNSLYLLSQRVPGSAKIQEVLGSTAHTALKIGKVVMTSTGSAAFRGASRTARFGRGFLTRTHKVR